MKNQRTPDQLSGELSDKMAALDEEFKDYLDGLKFIKRFDETQLKTFSPLDVVEGFEQRGVQRLREVGKKDMMKNEDGLRKLLANMLAQCRPGVLDQEDMDQLSGINGREVRGQV